MSIREKKIDNKKQIDRLDWLMKDKEKLKDFIEMVEKQDYDCQYCPFCDEEGYLMWCSLSADEDSVECKIPYDGTEEFLEEKMPTKEQIEYWEKECKDDKQRKNKHSD